MGVALYDNQWFIGKIRELGLHHFPHKSSKTGSFKWPSNADKVSVDKVSICPNENRRADTEREESGAVHDPQFVWFDRTACVLRIKVRFFFATLIDGLVIF